ncbi:hypothetical protein BD769DRAFT_1671964 [Suillus cothurnatus]|nr:hypothetical protein BD769DRAFT_1671964 [Suillus cothurnatus]
MSLNRNNIVSAGIDAKVYTWNLEAALKEQDSDRVGVRIIYVTVHSNITKPDWLPVLSITAESSPPQVVK